VGLKYFLSKDKIIIFVIYGGIGRTYGGAGRTYRGGESNPLIFEKKKKRKSWAYFASLTFLYLIFILHPLMFLVIVF